MAQKKEVPRPARKRPYRKPALVRHGNLKELTMVKGGNRTDGGSPKTRTAGGL